MADTREGGRPYYYGPGSLLYSTATLKDSVDVDVINRPTEPFLTGGEAGQGTDICEEVLIVRLFRWIQSAKYRAIASFVGAGIAAVVATGWAAFIYLHRGEQIIEVTYHICAGQIPHSLCPPGSVVLRCPGDEVEWLKDKCARYAETNKISARGGMCGYLQVDVKCTAKK